MYNILRKLDLELARDIKEVTDIGQICLNNVKDIKVIRNEKAA